MDDLLIHGKTRAEHDVSQTKVLEQARQVRIRFNKDKIEVAVPKVKYFGHTITSDGVEPDPDKIAAIQDIPAPTSKNELETILDMITYLSKFAPNLSELTSPLAPTPCKEYPF